VNRGSLWFPQLRCGNPTYLPAVLLLEDDVKARN